jgi:hypothetical protein
MTSKEFVIWLKGFSKAANEYNITPKQWETIVEQLNKVQDEISLQDSVRPYIDPTSIPKPIKIWYSTDTNSVPKDKTLLND